ncbi:hypothetical protein IMSAG013_00104 [Clostridiales bacterium]|nr:hypothetical protein IMSAG013_00104 [Clostridiales bacterium]
MEKNCSNCEFNFDGVCAGHGGVYKYGETITDETRCCDDWGANLDYFCDETTDAPRFLREAFNDCSLSYNDFSKQYDSYSAGKDIPINLFDAVKYIYGLSMVDIATIMDVSFGVVYSAKVKGIPAKRVKQFSDALCLEPEILFNGTTGIFPVLCKGKDKLFVESNIKEKLASMPEWKNELSRMISSNFHCPIHLAKEFARVDKFYWTAEMKMDDFTESEISLINYMKKHNKYNKPLLRMEYSLDRACIPHTRISLKNDK